MRLWWAIRRDAEPDEEENDQESFIAELERRYKRPRALHNGGSE